MKIAVGRSIYSNKIRIENITLRQLFKKLKSPAIRQQKDGAYFVFADFKKPIRNGENLIQHYGAVIDLDETNLTIEQIQQAFSKYKYAIYTTYSHKQKGKGDRYRIVLPYREPQPHERHREILFYIFNKLGAENVDLSSKAISRGMYFPSCPRRYKRHFKSIQKTTGKLFEIDITPQMRFEMEEMLDQSDTNASRFDINEKAPESNRNNSVAALVGKFIHNGMDMATIMQATKNWNDSNCEPPLDEKEVETIVNSIYKAHTRNNNTWGHDEILRRIKQSENINQDFEVLTQLIATGNKLKRSETEILTRALAKKSQLPISIVRDEIKAKQLQNDEAEEEESQQNAQKSAKTLRKEFAEWIYISRDDRVYHTTKGLMYKPEGFNKTYQSLAEKGSILNLLLKYHCIKTADVTQFHPGENKLFEDYGITYANTYHKPDLIPTNGSVTPMLRHFRKLINNKYERKILLDYIAFLVQNPGKKVLWMPVIKGRKRIGKSIVIDQVIARILGRWNVRNVESRKIGSDFNAWALDTQLVAFHELKIGNTRKEKQDLTDLLKEKITEPTMLAAKKGIDDLPVPNRLNMIGLTNHEDAIIISEDEGRFFMVRSEMEKQSRSYYNKLIRWFKKNADVMLDFFLERDISDFSWQIAPESDYTDEVKSSSLMWPNSVLWEALQDKKHLFNNDEFTTWSTIVHYIQSQSTGKDAIIADQLVRPTSSSGYLLNYALRDLGFRKWKNINGHSRVKLNGKLETVFATPALKHNINKYTPKQVRLILMQQKTTWDFDDE